MINLVVSLYRSGSTATMTALEAGGLHALLPDRCPCHDPEYPISDLRRHQCTSQHEFRTKVREATGEQFHQFNFPLMYPDETLIKGLYIGEAPALSALCYALAPHPKGYRVVFVWRHPWEIRDSFQRLMEEDPLNLLGTVHGSVPWITRGNNYEEAMKQMRRHFLNRRDVASFREIQFAPNYRADLPSLLEDTREVFDGLASDGWPIDVEKAVAVIDGSRRHSVAEDIDPDRMVG